MRVKDKKVKRSHSISFNEKKSTHYVNIYHRCVQVYIILSVLQFAQGQKRAAISLYWKQNVSVWLYTSLLHPFHSHPAFQWLHKHLMAALLCTPGPTHHSQPALWGTNQYTNRIMALSVNVNSDFFFSAEECYRNILIIWVCLVHMCKCVFVTLLRKWQQCSILQEPLAFNVACNRKCPAGSTHTLQETHTCRAC